MDIAKKTFFALILLFLLFSPIFKEAMGTDEIIEKQFEAIEKAEFDTFIEQLNSSYADYIPQYGLKDFISIIRGQESYDFKSLLNGVVKFFFHEISINLGLLGKLIIISITCAIMRSVQSAFESDNIGKVTRSFTFLLLIIIAIKSFDLALNIGKDAIDKMVSVIQALLPIISALLVSIGGITSAAILNPLIFMGISISSTGLEIYFFQ